MPTTITKYRIVHPLGYVEFADLAAAETYRDDWFPGAVIVTVTEDIPAP